jgi:hypothetical protein
MSYKEFPAMQGPEAYNLDCILKAMQGAAMRDTISRAGE